MEETKYPVDFEKCAQCGSTETLIGSELEAMKADHKMPPQAKAGLGTFQVPLANPLGISLSVPVFTAHIDACLKCGTVRVVHVEKTMGQMKMENQNAPTKRNFPGNGAGLNFGMG